MAILSKLKRLFVKTPDSGTFLAHSVSEIKAIANSLLISYKPCQPGFSSNIVLGKDLDPTDLEQVIYYISNLIEKAKYLIVVEDLNYLIKYNNSGKVSHFVSTLKDLVSSTDSLLIFIIQKKDLDKKFLNQIRLEVPFY